MRKLNLAIAGVALFGVGVGLGWYCGFARPSLRIYRDVKSASGMSDQEMIEAGKRIPEVFASMRREDEMAAVVGLRAIYLLEGGDVDAAKLFLAKWPAAYFRIYRDGRGNTNLIEKIETAARKYSVIAEAIQRNPNQAPNPR